MACLFILIITQNKVQNYLNVKKLTIVVEKDHNIFKFGQANKMPFILKYTEFQTSSSPTTHFQYIFANSSSSRRR